MARDAVTDQPVPEIIPITESVEHAIVLYLEHVAEYGERLAFSTKVQLYADIGVAVLDAMDLANTPPQPRTDPTLGIQRHALPFIVRAKVMARDGFKCVECSTRQRLTIDHIEPVSKGGTDEESNLRTLCTWCNSKKGAKVEGA